MGRRKQILPPISSKIINLNCELDITDDLFEPIFVTEEEVKAPPLPYIKVETRGRKRKYPRINGIVIKPPNLNSLKLNSARRRKLVNNPLFPLNDSLTETGSGSGSDPTDDCEGEDKKPKPNIVLIKTEGSESEFEFDSEKKIIIESLKVKSEAEVGQKPSNSSSSSTNQVKLEKSTMKLEKEVKVPTNICEYCPAAFLSPILLAKHRHQVHAVSKMLANSKNQRRCTLCFHMFFDHINFRRHMRLHAGSAPHLCPRCPPEKTFENRFPTFPKWLKHLKVKHYAKTPGDLPRVTLPFVCTYKGGCYQHFTSEVDLKLHAKSHKEKDKVKSSKSSTNLVPYFICERDGCGKMLKGNNRYLLHQELHARRDRRALITFTCEQCNESFGCKSSLAAHIRAHRKLYPCKVAGCGKSFVSEKNLLEHSTLHTAATPFKCNVKNCDLKFKSKTELNDHLRNHPSLKKYPCKICGESFDQGSQLRKHTQSAHEESQVARVEAAICPIPECRKILGDPAYLVFHMRTHSKSKNRLKPYLCEICEMPFSKESAKIVHEKKSHKDRSVEIVCPFPGCGKVAKKAGYMGVHLRRHHKNQKPPNPGEILLSSSMESGAESVESGKSGPGKFKDVDHAKDKFLSEETGGATFSFAGDEEEEFEDDLMGAEDDDFQLDQDYDDDDYYEEFHGQEDEDEEDEEEQEGQGAGEKSKAGAELGDEEESLDFEDEDLEDVELINCELD